MPDDDPWNDPVDVDGEEDETTFWRNLRSTAGSDRRNHGDRVDWFTAERARANLVVCRDCHRPIGSSCIEVGSNPPRVLTRFPAHVHRIADAAGLAQMVIS